MGRAGRPHERRGDRPRGSRARRGGRGGGLGSATIDPFNATIASAAAGDEDAFRRLIAAYHGEMHRVCVAMCGDQSVAEEAVQAAWAIPDDPPPDDSWIIHDQLSKPGEHVPSGSARFIAVVYGGHDRIAGIDENGEVY